MIRRAWHAFWHFWLGHPKPLRRDGAQYVCDLCGGRFDHGADWGI